MSYANAIDRDFLQRIVDDSIEVGCVQPPSEWQGRLVTQRRDPMYYLGFAHALHSAQDALLAKQDLRSLEDMIESNQISQDDTRYQDAKTLLEGRYHERVWVCFSQTIMGIGVALLAIACLTAVLSRWELVLIKYEFLGIKLLCAGGLFFAGAKLVPKRIPQQEAADRIKNTLYSFT